MPTPDDFKTRLRTAGIDAVLDEFVLCQEAAHVPQEQQSFIRTRLAETYDEGAANVTVCIVGSAKLGFSIREKKRKDGSIAPRYRPFGAESDVDVAVISRGIFEKVWDELSEFSHRSAYFPWRSNRLGDYLICGWLRPDHFPQNVRLRQCDDWWDCFRRITQSGQLGRRKVSGGLFYSMSDLRRYHSRAVAACLAAEEANP